MIMYIIMMTLVVLTVLWWVSIWAWLKANPVPPLVEIPDWRVRNAYRAIGVDYQHVDPTQSSSAFGVMSATASYYGPR